MFKKIRIHKYFLKKFYLNKSNIKRFIIFVVQNLSNLVINHENKINKSNKKISYYSTLISFPLDFVCFFLLKMISRIPLLYIDLTVSISASGGKSITL